MHSVVVASTFIAVIIDTHRIHSRIDHHPYRLLGIYHCYETEASFLHTGDAADRFIIIVNETVMVV